MENFWCVTVFFNPAKYQSLANNYLIFRENLEKQGCNLLTVELAFKDADFQLSGNNVLQLRSNSIMWQKERLINFGISKLPPECKYFAWIDCDVLFSDPHWQEMAVEKLKTNQIIQLFKKVYYLPKDYKKFEGKYITQVQSVIWQKIIHKNWLNRRIEKELPFSSPGFAWAAQRSAFDHCNGIYDKNIIGSGDTFLVDCMLDSWQIHGYYQKFNPYMKTDMLKWRNEFKSKPFSVNYIPVDIYHLYHGSLKDRKYMERHNIIIDNNYDPCKDIKLENDVYEWSSNKKVMHDSIEDYFFQRMEDK